MPGFKFPKTREQVPSVVERVSKHFWCRKVDVEASDDRGAVDGVWFAEDEADLDVKGGKNTIVLFFMHGGAYLTGKSWNTHIWKKTQHLSTR